MIIDTRYMSYDDWQNIRDENTGIVENSFSIRLNIHSLGVSAVVTKAFPTSAFKERLTH
ncbi:hypothetical protein [Emticicia sp.]|uniref:hypothetical protein n=1 Tax=Emticicia sp. TaxID=1930953 RepID=UPI003752663A